MKDVLTQEKSSFSVEESASDFFNTEYLKADLKGRSIRGGAVTVFAHVAKFVLRLGSTVVLARLLTPQDFGLIAMVTAITNFALMFKDIGLSAATIQKADINHSQISTLFWINVGFSLLITAAIAALAPAIAWFYGKPQLTIVTIVLAGAFIFGGLTVQHQALLRRQMRFLALGVSEVLGVVVGVTAAIVGACFGAGYWSLVLMHLGISVGTAIGVWIACPWRPGLPKLGTGVRKMLAFGGNVTGFKIVNYFARNLDKILLGKLNGSLALGLYNKAYGLMMLPINQIRAPLNMVALPALSSLQKEPLKFTRYYIKFISIIAFFGMPLMAFLAVCSENVIRLLLGNQWLETVDIFQVLALAAFIQPVASTLGLVLLSLGRSGRYLKWGILNSLIVVASFIVGIRWGAVGVASAYAAANYLALLPSLWYCFRRTPLSIASFIRAIARPTICSIAMAAPIALVHSFLVGKPDIVIIGVCFVIGFSAYLLVWSLMPGGRQMLRGFYGYVALIFIKGRGRLSAAS